MLWVVWERKICRHGPFTRDNLHGTLAETWRVWHNKTKEVRGFCILEECVMSLTCASSWNQVNDVPVHWDLQRRNKVISSTSTEIYLLRQQVCVCKTRCHCVSTTKWFKAMKHTMYCSYRKTTVENSAVNPIQKKKVVRYISKLSDDKWCQWHYAVCQWVTDTFCQSIRYSLSYIQPAYM